MSNARGYTLVEMLVALAVGMVVMQIAFTSFFFIQKYVRHIDRVDGMNQVAQSAVLWTIGKPSEVMAYPEGEQFSRVGLKSGGLAYLNAACNCYVFTIRDYHAEKYTPDKTFDFPLIVPVQGN